MSPERRALIVATGEYEHQGLARLPGAAADAESLSGVLGNPAIGHFAVQVVDNEPAHVIRERVEDFFSDSHPDDVLLLHFSCHGLKQDSGQLFFAARNTRPNRLQSTAVPAAFIQDCMRASRARSIVVLLDCCYGGAFSPGVILRATRLVNVFDSFPDARAAGSGHVVITATTSTQYAFEGDRLDSNGSPSPSVFTQAVVDGLSTGDADIDGDGVISLSEFFKYVDREVRQRNPYQTPSRSGEEQGDMTIAYSPLEISITLSAENGTAPLGAQPLHAWIYDHRPDGTSHPMSHFGRKLQQVVPPDATLQVDVEGGQNTSHERYLRIPPAEGMAERPVVVTGDRNTGRWTIRNSSHANTLRVQPFGLSAVPLYPDSSMVVPGEDVAVWIPYGRRRRDDRAERFFLLMLSTPMPRAWHEKDDRVFITRPRQSLTEKMREAVLMYFGEYLSWPPLASPHVRQRAEVESIANTSGLLDRRGEQNLARNRYSTLASAGGLFRIDAEDSYARPNGPRGNIADYLPAFHRLVERRMLTLLRTARWTTDLGLESYVHIDKNLLDRTGPDVSTTHPWLGPTLSQRTNETGRPPKDPTG